MGLAGERLSGGGCRLVGGGGSVGGAGTGTAASEAGAPAGSVSAGAFFPGTLSGGIEGTDRQGGGRGPAGPGPRLGLKPSNTALSGRLEGAFGGFFDSVMRHPRGSHDPEAYHAPG